VCVCVQHSRRREERERGMAPATASPQLELITADVVSNAFKKDVLTPLSQDVKSLITVSLSHHRPPQTLQNPKKIGSFQQLLQTQSLVAPLTNLNLRFALFRRALRGVLIDFLFFYCGDALVNARQVMGESWCAAHTHALCRRRRRLRCCCRRRYPPPPPLLPPPPIPAAAASSLGECGR
jgi:hypothetical protein